MARPCCKCSWYGTTFFVHKWGNGERLLLAACVGLPFSRYLRPKNNDQYRGKKKRPAPTSSTAGTCLSVVNFGNAPVPKVPRHLHQVNSFQEGMLEFDGPMGQCFNRFPTVSRRRRGEKRRKIRD